MMLPTRFATIIALAALTLGGCTELVQTGQKAGGHMRKVMYDSAGKVQELVRYDPGSNFRQMPQTAFCYRTNADIVCYDSPKPYISNRLIGYQGYTSPAVPATQHRAPANAQTVGAPEIVAVAVAETAPLEPVSAGESAASTGAAGAAPEPEPEPKPKATGNPQPLMPRF